MIDTTEIYDAALALNPQERAGLAYKLLQTLKPAGVWGEDDPNLPGELERRVLAFERGETTADDWETVSGRINEALENRNRT